MEDTSALTDTDDCLPALLTGLLVAEIFEIVDHIPETAGIGLVGFAQGLVGVQHMRGLLRLRTSG